ncbi:MAG: hypothetical protein M3P51_03215, partial [Chloroflexota bacterium]|nr:hypothetical protein [Chloroflexota bacterium]
LLFSPLRPGLGTTLLMLLERTSDLCPRAETNETHTFDQGCGHCTPRVRQYNLTCSFRRIPAKA